MFLARGECECGAPERPCKVDPIRLNALPEIQCCVETTLYGRQCEQTEETLCPGREPEVRDESGNIVSPAIPPSHCDHDKQMCVYEFTTVGEPDMMAPSCSRAWEQDEQLAGRGSPELVFLYVLEPDHAVELELVDSTFETQLEVRTSLLIDNQLSDCPGTDPVFCTSEALAQGPQYLDNTGSQPINVWVMVEGVGSPTVGDFTMLWKTSNMCTYGKTCHDGSCVEARPCQGGWYAGVPVGSLVSPIIPRPQIQVPSRWHEVSPADPERHLSPEECALEVQIAEPNANGATFQQGLCFAEMDLQVRASVACWVCCTALWS